MSRNSEYPFLILSGPTAVGKTELSLALAEWLSAEIISADSRQIYQGMSIGTAKPSPAERSLIPHHLVDFLPPDAPYSAGDFARDSEETIQEIVSRGKLPLITGGSTLYVHAVYQGFADIPPVPDYIRREMRIRFATEGAEQLFRELASVDPAAAATMDQTKTQRLLRALEVYHGTGQPISCYHDKPARQGLKFRLFVLTRDRKHLYARIDARVDRMIEDGLIEEVRSLIDAGCSPKSRALQTIGYGETIQYLNGLIDRIEMSRLIKRNTRRYAKRQLTWFRKYPEARWINLDDYPSRDEAMADIRELVRRP